MQSGSDRILELMNRTYTVDHYLRLVEKIRKIDAGGQSDDGYHLRLSRTETAEEHQMTLDLIREVRYDGAYTFKYSARANTKAWEMPETVPDEEKGGVSSRSPNFSTRSLWS